LKEDEMCGVWGIQSGKQKCIQSFGFWKTRRKEAALRLRHRIEENINMGLK
jgi:hypothetical protein